MNVSDSEIIITILSSKGFVYTDNIGQADIIIFNTCSVREHAEKRVLGRISNEVARKLRNKSIIIGVVGCMAQRIGAELHQINKKIDFVIGVDQYLQLPDIINKVQSKRKFCSDTTFDKCQVYSDIHPTRTTPHTAFVSITRGCDNFCSYCIVPLTRGRERSRSLPDIITEIKKATDENRQEILLLGQNVNSYLHDGQDFPDLLRQVNDIKNVRRIRFVTSHPKDLSDKLIDTMASCEKVCEHLHLPMQSGNDEILKKMNRGYTADQYHTLIKKIRKSIPNVAITTDIIAGFVGETEEQFADTVRLMSEIRFDTAFMFHYSERVGTAACKYTDIIPKSTRLTRLQTLIDVQSDITTQKYKQRIGDTVEVYVEGVSKRNKSEMVGKTRDYKDTVFYGSKDTIHQFVNVKITDAVGWTLKGELLS